VIAASEPGYKAARPLRGSALLDEIRDMIPFRRLFRRAQRKGDRRRDADPRMSGCKRFAMEVTTIEEVLPRNGSVIRI